MPGILVTGAGGQLAAAIIDEFAGSEVMALGRAALDIADPKLVSERVAACRPDVIINCAAYNKVDQAEDEPQQALAVNAFGVRSLARAAAEAGATLVHYSTDFVFDGAVSQPYTEEDAPNPASVYASSKLLGEWFAAEAPKAFVLRVESLFGGRAAGSSVDRIADAIVEGREARVFADRTVSPSYVVDVARATRALIERGEPGLYHCVNSGFCTWHELAHAIATITGRERDARLLPVKMSDVPLRATRPRFAALDNTKLRRAGVVMPDWRDALERYLRVRFLDHVSLKP